MNDLIIILVGPSKFIKKAARRAWKAAGVELLGPISIPELTVEHLRQAVGVVVDISQNADAVFELSELLEQRHVPFVYAVHEDQVQCRDGAYVISSGSCDINAIVIALSSDGDDGIRH